MRFRAEAASEDTARAGIERMRFALGVDHDLSEFHHRFWHHDLLGPVLRRKPWLRPRRRPEPWEALAWAVTEQLIEGGRASAIQRRMVFGHGRSTTGCTTFPARPPWRRWRPPSSRRAGCRPRAP